MKLTDEQKEAARKVWMEQPFGTTYTDSFELIAPYLQYPIAEPTEEEWKPEIDWNDDEVVVRAAVKTYDPLARLESTPDIWLTVDKRYEKTSTLLGFTWESARRQSPIVKAYERANRPSATEKEK